MSNPLKSHNDENNADISNTTSNNISNKDNKNENISINNNILMEEEMKKIKDEREKWEKEKSNYQLERNEEEYQLAMKLVDQTIIDLLPKIKEAKNIVDLFNRVTMNFDIVLEGISMDGIPKVKVKVDNIEPKYSIILDPSEFLPKLSILKDEMMKFKSAIENDRDYDIPERHDPLYLMFDNDFLLGTSIHWPEYTIYNLETTDVSIIIDYCLIYHDVLYNSNIIILFYE
jgi:hypothetical protein